MAADARPLDGRTQRRRRVAAAAVRGRGAGAAGGARRGWLCDTDREIAQLLAPWTSLDPHEEVGNAFERLGEEYTLVGLSNGDPDMLEAVKPSLGGPVDALLSSALAGVFKPRPEAYGLLVDRYDVAAHEVLFVAAHDFDIVGSELRRAAEQDPQNIERSVVSGGYSRTGLILPDTAPTERCTESGALDRCVPVVVWAATLRGAGGRSTTVEM